VTTIVVNLTPLVIPAGQTTATTDEIAIIVAPTYSAPSNILSVAGEVIRTAGARVANPISAHYELAAIAVDPGQDTTLTIETAGEVRVESTVADADSPAIGVWSYAGPFRLVNHGAIEVESSGTAFGAARLLGGPNPQGARFENLGLVHVTSTGAAATGFAAEGADFTNTSRIEVVGATAATGVRLGDGPDVSLFNSGTITAQVSNGGAQSVGVLWSFHSNDSGIRFDNEGQIEGDYALKVENLALSATADRYFNDGVMIGKVDLGLNYSSLTNGGRIYGAVDLGAGDDVYDGREGMVTGMVSGGDGADSLAGGGGFDNFQGNAGRDTESGGAGDDWVVGGKDNDSLSGDDGGDLVYGNIGNDTCDGGAGNDIVRGGQDNDSLNGGAGDDFVSGDKGDDTMVGGAGADIFHTFGDAGIDLVMDFHPAEGDRVMLDPGTVSTLDQVGADTVISMTGGGKMVLVSVQLSTMPAGWIFGA
jgi:Ca2+-binding RTX toxin-like protein